MAEGGIELDSRCKVSDQLTRPGCDSCQYDGTAAEGIAFCAECKEYLCQDCLKVHKKSKLSRDHKILEGDSIDEASDSTCETLFDFIYCDFHPGCAIEFYCQSHNEVLCLSCKKHHKTCSDVKSIEEISEAEEEKDLIFKCIENAKALKGKIEVLQQTKKECKISLESQKEKCLKDVKDLHKNLNEKWRDLEQKLQDKVQHFVLTETKVISDQLKTLGEASLDIDKYIAMMEGVSTRKRGTVGFLARRNLGTRKAESVFETILQETQEVLITVQADAMVQNMLKNMQDMAHLQVAGSKYDFNDTQQLLETPYSHVPDLTEELKHKRTVLLRTVSVEDENTEQHRHPSVNCISILPEGKVLVIDSMYEKILILDCCYRIEQKLQVKKIWDLAVVNSQEVVATCNKHLQFIKMHPRMRLGHRIEIGKPCYGIAYQNSKIYVACQSFPNRGEILIVNRAGETLTRHAKDAKGTCLFRMPQYVAVDRTGRLYVSDEEQDVVICLNASGSKEYSNEVLQDPAGIMVDNNQNAYVCSLSSYVKVITCDGKKCTKWLKLGSAAVKLSTCIAYRNSDKTIFIGSGPNIAVFQIV